MDWCKACDFSSDLYAIHIFNFLGFLFNKVNCFQKKKKDHFLTHWVQEYAPVKASNRPAVGLTYFTALAATLSSGIVSTSDIWLLLNKDPSVWISEAWKPAQWLEIGFSGTTQKKNPTVATPKTKTGTTHQRKVRTRSRQQHSELVW